MDAIYGLLDKIICGWVCYNKGDYRERDDIAFTESTSSHYLNLIAADMCML